MRSWTRVCGIMYSDKKITKEDTWRPEDLRRHLQGQDRKSQRKERSKREEVQRTHRTGESTERTRQDSETDVRRERERQREKESTSERTNLREPEKEREEESRRKEKREKERRKERERVGEHLGWERRTERDDKETKDREEKQIQRYKKRDEKLGRYKERDREKERYRDKDREAERDRWKEKEREKQRKGREKNRERGGRKDYDWEKEREGGEREKERERERRRAERGKEEKAEKERGKEKEGSVEDKHREKEKEHERERRERHREREYSQEQEEWRERKRREKAGHRQLSGPVDREERERRKREKELWEAEENGGALHNAREAERHNHHHHHPGGEGGADRDRTRAREKHKEKRYEDSKSSHGNRDQGVESDEVGGMKNEDYEEDFEDYEEDFEEVDEDEGKEEEEDENGESEGWRELSAHRSDEIKAIQRAMEEENELVSATLTRPPTKEAEAAHRDLLSAQTERRPARVQTHGRVIDFTAARQREVSQQAARRQQKRSVELLRLIELDFSVTESLLDLPPVSEYDMYIKSFGMSNTKQVYVQCNEDNTDQDTQTEEPDTHEKWTLHPAETNAVSGGPKVSQNAQESVAWMNGDSKRLSTFLHSAAQVIAVLLEENRTGSDSVKGLDSHIDSLSCSDRTLQLNTKLPLIHGRQVTLLHFSNVQVHILLSVHAPRCGPSEDTLDTHTLLCVWNIWEPSAPQKFLICEAEVQSCCFSPGQLSLVFAGTAVGSVLLWDLREHSGSHMCLRVNTEEWTLRYPTFSTDAVLSVAGHLSSVVSVEPVLVTMEAEFRGPLLAAQEESLGLSFQLGSLDENGLLILWVVVELPKADDSGSQTDLGLRPGGKVKLLHSSSLQTCDGSTSRGVAEVTEVMPHLSLLLRFLPSDSNHYFIGTNMGQVKRGTRHGLRVVPKLYTPAEGMRPAEVTALDFCPNREPFFLVGCSDATVRLHSLVRAEPMCGWSVGSGSVPTHTVCWCQTRLTVFFVLDATSVLHVWDLAEREDGPISSENLHPDRVTGMAVFGDADNRRSSSGFALVRQSGRLEIHFLKQSLALFRTSDMKTLRSLAHNML